MAASDDTVTVTMTRSEALALAKVGDLGLRAAEAFNLIQNTGTAERAIARLNEAATRPRRRS